MGLFVLLINDKFDNVNFLCEITEEFQKKKKCEQEMDKTPIDTQYDEQNFKRHLINLIL
jgi:hypothetical protein